MSSNTRHQFESKSSGPGSACLCCGLRFSNPVHMVDTFECWETKVRRDSEPKPKKESK